MSCRLFVEWEMNTPAPLLPMNCNWIFIDKLIEWMEAINWQFKRTIWNWRKFQVIRYDLNLVLCSSVYYLSISFSGLKWTIKWQKENQMHFTSGSTITKCIWLQTAYQFISAITFPLTLKIVIETALLAITCQQYRTVSSVQFNENINA